MAQICHMFLFRLLKVKIMSKKNYLVKTLLKMLISALMIQFDPVVCKDGVHLIDQNSPIQNSTCML